MSIYETYILPKFLDCVCSQEGFQNKRAQIFPHASGEGLEIGVGTGLSFTILKKLPQLKVLIQQ